MNLENLNDLCQSCGMPVVGNKELMGTNSAGALILDFCKYCIQSGEFTTNPTMSEMIDICVPHLVKEGVTKEKAIKHMSSLLPKLKRWQ